MLQHSEKPNTSDAETGGPAVGQYGICTTILIIITTIVVIITLPFSLLVCLKVVQEYERAVIFRLGRIRSIKAQGPGLFFILPCVDDFVKVDLRIFTHNIPPQEGQAWVRVGVMAVTPGLPSKILTKDSVTVVVDAVIYARVDDATLSVVNIEDARVSTHLLGATTLRTILGTVGLSELLSDRERIDKHMQVCLDEATMHWGVKVERVEIKDVRLPVQMQRAMAAEAESNRNARAKVVAAEGELKASRSLKEAAEVMDEAPTALQLRYLQTLHAISEEKHSTIIFPVPVDLLHALRNAGRDKGTTQHV